MTWFFAGVLKYRVRLNADRVKDLIGLERKQRVRDMIELERRQRVRDMIDLERRQRVIELDEGW